MKTIPLITLIILIISASLLAVPAAAMINPAAGYCTALGYNYTEKTAADGSMTGYCTLSGNQSVDAWQFLYGNASGDKSYCAVHGMQIQTVENASICGMIGNKCGACVQADGSVKEVTAAMGLDFREKICSGSICCDPAKDTTCSIGAEEQQETDGMLPVLAVIVIVLVLLGLAYIYIQKKKGKPQGEKKP